MKVIIISYTGYAFAVATRGKYDSTQIYAIQDLSKGQKDF